MENQIGAKAERPAAGGEDFSDKALKTLSLDELVKRTRTSVNTSDLDVSSGLKPEEAEERLRNDGKNCMTPKPPVPLWKRFGKHLLDPMLVLLDFAGVLSIATALSTPGDTTDLYLGILLFILVVCTAGLSFFQEGQAESAMQGFQKMMPQNACVRRGGVQTTINAVDLVRGDIVILSTGDRVPADVALLTARGLRIDMSSMTGESLPVKMCSILEPPAAGESIALSGSQVMAGNGTGIVVRTGDRCTIGQIASLANQASTTESTLRRNVEHFVKLIAALAIVMAAAMFIVTIIQQGTKNILQRIVSSFIVVLVANVPEGLPAAVSGCLAVAARRMAAKNVLVKRLEVLDTLGAVTTICTDKTGTLTQNHMAVACLFYEGEVQPADSLSHPRHLKELKSAEQLHGLFDICFSNDPLHCTIVFSALCNQATATDFVQIEEAPAETKLTAARTQDVRIDMVKRAGSGRTGKAPDAERHGSLVLGMAESSDNVARFKSSPVLIDDVTIKRVRTMPIGKQDFTNINRAEAPVPTRGKADALRKQTRVPRERDVVAGNASDVAMFCFAERYVDVMELRQEIRTIFMVPFSSERKWMATIHGVPAADRTNRTSKHLLIVKGALERILPKCKLVLKKGAVVPLTPDAIAEVESACGDFARRGERVLVMAMATLPAQPDSFSYTFEEDEAGNIKSNFTIDNLTLISCLALHDPPKVGVADAVLKCQRAGIRVIMITGDHPATAEAIARHVNIIKHYHTREEIAAMNLDGQSGDVELAGAAVVTGAEMESMTDQQWDELLSMHEIVFARTSPMNKLEIVTRLQAKGEICAMTGGTHYVGIRLHSPADSDFLDGVNDSPALRRADIGIAMGLRGHDVARDAADVVLVDDDFCTIVNGIEEGRLIFDNLRKIIAYTLTHLVAEVAAIAITLLAGLPPGLNSFMILSIDLGTEVCPSLSLSYETAEDAIMQRPPRDDKVDRLVSIPLFLYMYVWAGIPVAMLSIGAYLLVFQSHGIPLSELVHTSYFQPGCGPLLIGSTVFSEADQQYILSSAQSAFLGTIVLSQFWHIFHVKTRVNSIFEHGVFNNRLMNAGVLVELGLVIAIVYVPFMNSAFGTAYGGQTELWTMNLVSAVYLTGFNEFRKYMLRKDLTSTFSHWMGW
ncbi:unnamed protein product (mitochondrion) [Plasmodiophora brassicae]|uniref:Cation-transporting P-type ATPase N-terminal domain-containing protein n=1 Tax=Plasmodiophora brassicae TaxID=37360 RepID=A0A3P3Y0H1_PLABS|nr:unnamed protein product [Plasmodiophora brassicae]